MGNIAWHLMHAFYKKKDMHIILTVTVMPW